MRLFFPVLVVLSFSACSTEVDLEADWKDIPVVYGILSRLDTAHYIRIEKAFLEPGGDAAKIAQIADSLYYANLTVELEKSATGQRFSLRRVDGNLEGYPRQAGPFAQAPNYLYKINAQTLGLKGGEKIRLIILRGEGKAPVTAETTILSDLAPRDGSPPNPINMGYDRTITLSWTAPVSARIFDVRLVMRYQESDPGNVTVLKNKSVEWILARDLERTDDAERMAVTFSGEQFYRFLGEAISVQSSLRRYFSGIDLVIAGGGQEFVDFLRLTRVNTGITSSQFVPVYSNLSEGRGIFSSRTLSSRSALQLSPTAVDSLRFGRYTKALNFQ